MRTLALLLLVWTAPAQDTWVGHISDSLCRAHHDPGEGNEHTSNADCTRACVRGGSRYVLVIGKEILNIANPAAPGLDEHAGLEVRVTGSRNGDTITITRIERKP